MATAKLKDIARLAGVSTATVSLALNNKKGVSAKKTQEIKQIALDLGYLKELNDSTDGKTITFVQIIKPNQTWDDSYKIFIADYFEGLTLEANKFGMVIESKIFETADLQAVVRSLDELDTYGIIFLGAGLYQDDIMILKGNRTQSVFIDVHFPGLKADFIDMDNTECVYSIIEYIKEKGYKRIGLVQAEEKTPNFRFREEAFYQAMSYYGIEWDPSLRFVINKDQQLGKQQFIEKLQVIDKRPDVVFCVNDMIAYNCIHACYDMGLKMPEDLALIGFDDLPTSRIINPNLTSINISKKEIARRALQRLLDRIQYSAIKPTETVLINGSLIERKSC